MNRASALCRAAWSLATAAAVVVVVGAGGAQAVGVALGTRAPCAVTLGVASVRTASLSFVRGPSILLASTDGRHVSTILRGASSGSEVWYQDPAWSRDGRCLAFSRLEYFTHSEEAVAAKRGTRTIEIGGGIGGHDESPSWAPDGRRLVLVGSQGSAGGGLYVEGVGVSSAVALTPELWSAPRSSPWTADDMPAWAPDGSRVVFTRTLITDRGTGGVALYLIRPNGQGLQRLTTIDGRNASWAPDGRRIAIDDGRRIVLINADGRSRQYLTDPKGADADPAWSPDGRTIAFVRYPSAKATNGDIWLMDASGGHQRLFVKNGEQPAWKPR